MKIPTDQGIVEIDYDYSFIENDVMCVLHKKEYVVEYKNWKKSIKKAYSASEFTTGYSIINGKIGMPLWVVSELASLRCQRKYIHEKIKNFPVLNKKEEFILKEMET